MPCAFLDGHFDEDRILDDWRHLYNGYRFSDLPRGEAVYNPFTLVRGLMDVLDATRTLRDRAVRGHWPSVWGDTSHPRLALLLADPRRTPETGRGGLRLLERPDLRTLMLETGYHTFHFDEDADILDPPRRDFPNLEVARAWADDILALRREGSGGGDERPFAAVLSRPAPLPGGRGR